MTDGPVDPAMLATALEHFEAERFAEAEEICNEILSSAPHDFWTLRLLGASYAKQDASSRAVQVFRKALSIAPPDETIVVSVMNELASALLAEGNFEAALECCLLAAARKPDEAATHYHCASALVGLNRHMEALEQYRLARSMGPDSHESRFNESALLVALGDWLAGWELYEERLFLPEHYAPDAFASTFPYWRGDTDIRGKTILLQAEQGLGDTVQYVRYAPLVAARGARVILRVYHHLAKLLADFPGTDAVVTLDDKPEGIDLHCRLMSLPAAFRTTIATVPADVPYIRVAPEYRMIWEALLGPRRRTRIGIVWSGRQHIPFRSVPLAELAPLFARADIEFHGLQPEMLEPDRDWLTANPVLVDHSAELKDFSDTAALASLMDLVITIDTSVAHIAGALGLPVWIMLPFSADSRWLLDRSDSPWYPTARLFRQKRLRDWGSVVSEVLNALP